MRNPPLFEARNGGELVTRLTLLDLYRAAALAGVMANAAPNMSSAPAALAEYADQAARAMLDIRQKGTS